MINEIRRTTHRETYSGRDAFIYLSFRPNNTASRIEQWFLSLEQTCPYLDFFVVTFDSRAEADVENKKFGSIYVRHIVYNTHKAGTLPYPAKVIFPNFKLIPGNTDIPILLFWKENDHYDRYWIIEDDVEYTGDIGNFIDVLRNTEKNAQLSCTHVRTLPDVWDYTWMFGTGTDRLPKHLPLKVCFLPFRCVSAAALGAIDAAYRRGWCGHDEMTWPNIMDFAGMRIRDIGGNGPYVASEDRNLRYIDFSPTDYQKRGSFGTMNIRLRPGQEANILWHPVKKFQNWFKMKRKRAISIIKWHYSRIKSSRD